MSSPRLAMCRCILLEPNDLPQDIRNTNTCLIDFISNIVRFNIENTEKYIPQVLSADQLETINYKKGCYTGQEVIARTHYLGNVKKHMYLVNIYSSKIKEKNIFIIKLAKRIDTSEKIKYKLEYLTKLNHVDLNFELVSSENRNYGLVVGLSFFLNR